MTFSLTPEERSSILPQVIPPSPNAYSLGIYGDIPVSQYTGIPNINIPLYKIDLGTIVMPIELNYHASGIKVAQEASWVGLGWSLNAGGVITRSINGWDDFATYPLGYVLSEELPVHDEFSEEPDYYFLSDGTIDYSNINMQKLIRYSQNTEDSQPDIFCYNFGIYSGKMVFPKQNGPKYKPILLNQDPINFEYENFRGGSWRVTTPDGCIYYFGTKEVSTLYSSSSGSAPDPENFYMKKNEIQSEVVNSWYLDSIKYQNNIVRFVYDENTKIKTQPIVSQQYIPAGVIIDEVSFYSNNVNSYTANQQVISEVILKEIIFKNGKIVFTTKDRLDIMKGDIYSSPQCLSSISVLNNSEEILSYIFQTDYFCNYADAKGKRLRLNQIIDNADKTYKFEYSTNDLPLKNSLSIDHWGYYNGASNFQSVIPTFQYGGPTQKFYHGANREANENYVLAGILKKIEFPAGGYSSFDYSLNEYNHFSTYLSEISASGINEWDPNLMLWDTTYFDMTVGGDIELKSTLYILPVKPDAYGCCVGCSYDENNREATWHYFNSNEDYLIIQKQNSLDQWEPFLSLKYFGINCNDIKEGADGLHFYDVKTDMLLSQGNYRIVAKPEVTTSVNASMWLLKEKTNHLGGGVRIQKINHFDGSDASTTTYEYILSDGLTTSGILLTKPKYIYDDRYHFLMYSNMIFSSCYVTGVDGFVVANSEGTQMLALSGGGYVGYSRVVETSKSSNNASGGKTVYHFINNAEYMTSRDATFPGIPYQVHNSNGLLISKEYYNAGNTLIKLQEFSYTPKDENTHIIEGIKLLKLPDFWYFSSRIYYMYSERLELTEDKTMIYDFNGQNPLETINQYEYNNSNYKLLSKKTILNSDGNYMTTLYKYPYDFPNLEPYSSMVNKNNISTIVEQSEFLNSRFIQKKVNEYKDWGNNIVAVEHVKSQTKSQVIPKSDIRYHKYDIYGNPTSITVKNNLTYTYLWSYNGQYPIAEIQNATNTEVANALVGTTPDQLSSSIVPDMTKVEALRAHPNLSKAQITTYTYKPLVGITSKTDPRGVKTFYEYDEFNRLKYIKDTYGNIIQKFDYHYKE